MVISHGSEASNFAAKVELHRLTALRTFYESGFHVGEQTLSCAKLCPDFQKVKFDDAHIE